MADKNLGPLPLTAPDGEIIAYACPRCLQVSVGGHYVAPPNAEQRREAAELSRRSAANCCLCACGNVRDTMFGPCSACYEKDRPEREAYQAKRDAEDEDDRAAWVSRMTDVLRNWTDDWPLTVIVARDGLGYAAFPLDLEQIPSEMNERVEATEWLCVHGADLFGLAATPEAAIEDLRAKAKRVR